MQQFSTVDPAEVCAVLSNILPHFVLVSQDVLLLLRRAESVDESPCNPTGCGRRKCHTDGSDDVGTRNPHHETEDYCDDDDQRRIRSLRPHLDHQFCYVKVLRRTAPLPRYPGRRRLKQQANTVKSLYRPGSDAPPQRGRGITADRTKHMPQPTHYPCPVDPLLSDRTELEPSHLRSSNGRKPYVLILLDEGEGVMYPPIVVERSTIYAPQTISCPNCRHGRGRTGCRRCTAPRVSRSLLARNFG